VAVGAIARIFSTVSKWRSLQPGLWIEVGADSVMSVLLFHRVSETLEVKYLVPDTFAKRYP
jgi:hypothetical protein